jgi:hypothetical protein
MIQLRQRQAQKYLKGAYSQNPEVAKQNKIKLRTEYPEIYDATDIAKEVVSTTSEDKAKLAKLFGESERSKDIVSKLVTHKKLTVDEVNFLKKHDEKTKFTKNVVDNMLNGTLKIAELTEQKTSGQEIVKK